LIFVLARHISSSPRWIWLALLVGEALDRVLPKGRGTWVIHAYRLVVGAALVVIAIPFMVDQIRTAIYPDLEIQRTLTFPLSSGSPVVVSESSVVGNEAPSAFEGGKGSLDTGTSSGPRTIAGAADGTWRAGRSG
jgi:hypothetical protein